MQKYTSFFILHSYGIAGNTNVTGDEVKKLDVFANDLFVNMLRSSYTTALMVSEENENCIEVDTEKQVSVCYCQSFVYPVSQWIEQTYSMVSMVLIIPQLMYGYQRVRMCGGNMQTCYCWESK